LDDKKENEKTATDHAYRLPLPSTVEHYNYMINTAALPARDVS